MLLNQEQQQVVEELDANILLVASAGTGKTNTLAHRVAHLIESGRCQANQILCMTFTNKACGEMQDRIRNLVGSIGKAVEVSTFHSFCYAILQEEGKRNESLYRDLSIFDEVDCDELLGAYRPRGMRPMNWSSLVALLKEYRSLYGFYSDKPQQDYEKTMQKLVKEHRARLENLCTLDFRFSPELLTEVIMTAPGAVTKYDQDLRSVHAIDFQDIICHVHRLFQDPTIRDRWRKRFSYIAVDEMQDTGRLEYRVLDYLWEGNHVLLCGDYFQTIYEWRGSDPFQLLKEFKDKYQPKQIIFYDNYRANQTLFEASFLTLRRMFPHLLTDIYDKMPRSVSGQAGAPIEIYRAASKLDEAQYIFDKIQTLPRKASVGVLVRGNKKAIQLSESFERINMTLPEQQRRQFMVIDEYKFFRRQEIKDVMAYFKLLMNPNDAVSAKRIIKRYVSGIGEGRIQDIESPASRQAGLKLTDFMDWQIFTEEPYARLIAGLECDEVVVYDVESTGVDTTQANIVQIAAARINQQGQVLEKFMRFIRPEQSVGDSVEVHGFSDEWLAEHGEDPVTVLKAFREFSKNAIIVGHNVNYDVSIFTSELHRHKLPAPAFKAVYDTLDMARRFYPNLSNHKLGFLSEYFKEEFLNYHEPTHNAWDDIMATAQLLLMLVTKNIQPTETKRKALISQYKSQFAMIASQMATLRRKINTDKPTDLLAYIMNDMGVLNYYKSRREMEKVEHIRSLYTLMRDLDEAHAGAVGLDRLHYILQLAALNANEPLSQGRFAGRIPIITVHQAKGSEFDHVFLTEMNANEFPLKWTLKEGREDEEKRLFYVAITRPKQSLTITFIKRGCEAYNFGASPFLAYLPNDAELVHSNANVWEVKSHGRSTTTRR